MSRLSLTASSIAIRAFQKGRMAAVLAAALAVPSVTLAAWHSNPSTNDAVCTAAGTQADAKSCTDGLGGAIIAWRDARGADDDIYAQRVQADGTMPWTFNGLSVCSATGTQTGVRLVSDLNGGAILVWQDGRSGIFNIYAQRLDANGNALWASGGIELTTTTAESKQPEIISDGSGGAIVCWKNYVASNTAVYAQRLSSAGAFLWTPGGVVVRDTSLSNVGETQTAKLCEGATSGTAIIAWSDKRSGTEDIYAQRLDSSGAAVWAANGIVVCNSAGTQTMPAVGRDGSGGAVIAWRHQDSQIQTYAQRITSAGSAVWTNGGELGPTMQNIDTVSVESSGSTSTLVVTGGLDRYEGTSYDPTTGQPGFGGGAMLIFNQTGLPCAPVGVHTGGTTYLLVNAMLGGQAGITDIFGTRVNVAPASYVYSQATVTNATTNQRFPTAVSAGNGTAIVGWEDLRNGNSDIYVSMLKTNGALLPVALTSLSVE